MGESTLQQTVKGASMSTPSELWVPQGTRWLCMNILKGGANPKASWQYLMTILPNSSIYNSIKCPLKIFKKFLNLFVAFSHNETVLLWAVHRRRSNPMLLDIMTPVVGADRRTARCWKQSYDLLYIKLRLLTSSNQSFHPGVPWWHKDGIGGLTTTTKTW